MRGDVRAASWCVAIAIFFVVVIDDKKVDRSYTTPVFEEFAKTRLGDGFRFEHEYVVYLLDVPGGKPINLYVNKVWDKDRPDTVYVTCLDGVPSNAYLESSFKVPEGEMIGKYITRIILENEAKSQGIVTETAGEPQ